MTTKNEQLHSIQARIEELQNTIEEKEAQLKTRGRHLREELEGELSPDKLIRNHPFQAIGLSFVAGLLVTRALKGKKSRRPAATGEACTVVEAAPSATSTALAGIGLEVLRSAKDLGIGYLQRYIDRKIK
ncbi:MAG: hypothetical protein WCH05_05600 [Chlorobiaceae bacterium]